MTMQKDKNGPRVYAESGQKWDSDRSLAELDLTNFLGNRYADAAKGRPLAFLIRRKQCCGQTVVV